MASLKSARNNTGADAAAKQRPDRNLTLDPSPRVRIGVRESLLTKVLPTSGADEDRDYSLHLTRRVAPFRAQKPPTHVRAPTGGKTYRARNDESCSRRSLLHSRRVPSLPVISHRDRAIGRPASDFGNWWRRSWLPWTSTVRCPRGLSLISRDVRTALLVRLTLRRCAPARLRVRRSQASARHEHREAVGEPSGCRQIGTAARG